VDDHLVAGRNVQGRGHGASAAPDAAVARAAAGAGGHHEESGDIGGHRVLVFPHLGERGGHLSLS